MTALVSVGSFVVNFSADMTRLKSDTNAGAQIVESTSKRMAKDVDDVGTAYDGLASNIKDTTAAVAPLTTATTALAVAERNRAAVTSSGLAESTRLLNVAREAANDAAASFQEVKIDPKQFAGADQAIKDLDAKFDRASASWQEKIAYGVGAGVGAGAVTAHSILDKLESAVKAKLVITGIAIATGITAAALTAVYATYKIVSGSMGFISGLFTGESYKSENIDALLKMNDEVKSLQENLQLTAVGASALNEALKLQGVEASTYTSTINAAANAVRTNKDELDRLGVAYKDQAGNLLPVEEVLKNAAAVLGTYTEGWDRQQAATAIGMGTEKQIQDTLSVSAEKIQTAKDRLADYNLVIGEESQKAASDYQKAMREFNREADLTSQGFKRAIADQVMPILTQLAEFFREGFPSAVNAFRYSMATVTSLFFGLKTVVYAVAESVLGGISSIGSGLAGVATAGVRAFKGDFSGAKDALVQGWTDAKSRLGQIGDNIVEQARRNAAAMRLAWGTDSLTANDKPNQKPKTGKAWTPKPDEEEDVAQTASEYDKLIQAIKEKIAAQQLDYESTGTLTEGQKIAAKFVADLRDHVLELTDAQKLAVTRALEELIAYEKANEAKREAAKIEKSIKDYLDQSAIARQEAAQQLAVEYQLFGKSNDAREIALIQIKAQAEAEKLIAKLKKDGDVTQEQTDRIRDEADARAQVAQATLSQSKALNYANQLLLDNRKFAAESILDDRQRAAALLQIDVDMWQERIRLAGEGTEAQKRLQEQFAQWYQNQLAKPDIDASRKLVDQVNGDFQQGLRDALNRGESLWGAWTKSIGNTLKSALGDALYKTFLQKYVVNAVLSISGMLGLAGGATAATAAAGAAQGANAMSSVGSVASIASLFGSGGLTGALAGGAGWLTGATTFTGALSAAGSLIGTGSAAGIASGLGVAAGALGPVVLGALALKSLIGSGGETRYGGGYDAINGKVVLGGGPSGGEIQGDQVRQSIQSAYDGLTQALKALGSSATVERFTAGLESSQNGKGATFAGGFINGQQFGSTYESTLYNQTLTQDQALAQFSQKLQQSVLLALRQAGDIPKTIIDELKAADIEKLSADQATALVNSVNTEIASVSQFQQAVNSLPFSNLKNLSFDAADALVKLSGGIQNLQSGISFIAQNFFTEEEQMKSLSDSVQKALGDLGYTGIETKEQFKELVFGDGGLKQGIDVTTEAGAKLFAQLEQIAPSFAKVADYYEQQRQQADQAAQDAIAKAQESARQAEQQRQQAIEAARADVSKAYEQAIEAARADVSKAYEQESSALQSRIDQFSSYASSLRSFMSSLMTGSLSTLSPEEKYFELKRQFEQTDAQARAGDTTALGNLQGISQQFLEASKNYFATSEGFVRDSDAVQQSLAASANAAQSQVDIARSQLAGINQEVAGILQVNQSVLSLHDALAAFRATQSGGGAGSAAASAAAGATTSALGTYTVADGRLTGSVGGVSNFNGVDVGNGVFWDSQNGFVNINNVPKFAGGGYHEGGLAVVGERGPELVNFSRPSQIYTAEQTRSILGGDGGSVQALVTEVKALRAEVRRQGEANTRQRAAVHDDAKRLVQKQIETQRQATASV